ncbi:MAG: type 11 methyltransferase [Anaerolineaceae bacterium]|nr:MAG: type 11 methyltransferase [Anaerolineaceae bacterium]
MANISFSDIALEFDDLFEDVDRLTNLEGDALDNILKPNNVISVLDCACGTGIQSIGLSRRGYKVSASDISVPMLSSLNNKARQEGLDIEVKKADFRNLRPWKGRKFDAIISCGNSLTLLESDIEIANSLTSMLSCLQSPGVGIIGIHNYLRVAEHKEHLFIRKTNLENEQPEIIFDIRMFGKKRVKVSYFFLREQNHKWRLKTYTKSYLLLDANDLKDRMLNAGFDTVKLLDISGQRNFNNDDEWILAAGYIKNL